MQSYPRWTIAIVITCAVCALGFYEFSTPAKEKRHEVNRPHNTQQQTPIAQTYRPAQKASGYG